MDNNQPLVSVITPTFNSSDYVVKTIESVQSQSYQNWEMIIIDDCSSDNTVELVKGEISSDPRLKLIQNQENKGAAVSRNSGINLASGRYIAFLDSDDIWSSKKLETQISFMQKNNYFFTFTSYSLIDKDGNKLNKMVRAKDMLNYKNLLSHPGAIGCLTVVLDKHEIQDITMPNIRTRQDFALWLKILKEKYTAYGLDIDLAFYRKVPGSISSNKIKAAKKNWYVYRKIEKLSLIPATWYFLNYAYKAIVKTFLK
ncbi:glycosyltransferase family 2 protein [Gracilibacillus kekensis]|uniref:Teichuronic acid biosynthesis glycosyltransferase TuaG n=1 Tax=Gracilibacillus kekensis TaxID=1027249 RepID=A0A1M7K7N9_9BACI|nr:glycosyltransferase family 2 protein [Gracilibacillus kekensis]SHM61258.1 teichuronic acid biosynthesis glycosyltransferase TuaG [Gracilibacillus kekensis]